MQVDKEVGKRELSYFTLEMPLPMSYGPKISLSKNVMANSRLFLR